MSAEAFVCCDNKECDNTYQTEPISYGGTACLEWIKLNYKSQALDFCSLECLLTWISNYRKPTKEIANVDLSKTH